MLIIAIQVGYEGVHLTHGNVYLLHLITTYIRLQVLIEHLTHNIGLYF